MSVDLSVKIPKLLDHAGYRRKHERLARRRRQHAEAEKRFNELCRRPESDGARGAEQIFAETDDDPTTIAPTGEHEGEKQQAYLRMVALSRALPKLEADLRRLEPIARRELQEQMGLKGIERELLASIKATGEKFGAACMMYERFLDSLRDADLALPSHQWTLHPGTLSDGDSNINCWLKELKTYGIEI